jgi:hypothetical protein
MKDLSMMKIQMLDLMNQHSQFNKLKLCLHINYQPKSINFHYPYNQVCLLKDLCHLRVRCTHKECNLHPLMAAASTLHQINSIINLNQDMDNHLHQCKHFNPHLCKVEDICHHINSNSNNHK